MATKRGNPFTVSRLLQELDISFDKADQVVRELARTGIAEIDLEHSGPDNALVYRVKGL
ncbi:MAG: hypothetical protein AB1473_06970 [Thermodesulfobacteriota bacterium]